MTTGKNTATEYADCIGAKNVADAPISLIDAFDLGDGAPQTEATAWKELWKGMPAFTPVSGPYKTMAVYFRNDEDFDAFMLLVGAPKMRSIAKTMWFPAIEKADNYLTRFIDEAE